MFNQEWLNGYYNAIRNGDLENIWWGSVNFDLLDESMLREILPFIKRDAHTYFRTIKDKITPDFLREIKEEVDVRWILYEWYKQWKYDAYAHKGKSFANLLFREYCESELIDYRDLWEDSIKDNNYVIQNVTV